MSNWNLDLVQNCKELIFNANLPIILLFIFVLYTWKNKFKKIFKISLTVILLLFMFFCFHFTPNILMHIILSAEDKLVETNYIATKNLIEIPSCIKKSNGIVILGAGDTYADTPSHYGMTRLLGFIELLNNSKETNLWKRNKNPIVFSGGFTNKDSSLSEAQVLKKYATFIYGNKFSEFNAITENNSLNTYQNSLYSAEFFNGKHFNKNIILITNTFHMLRAKKTFEAQGFTVCPVSVSAHDIYGDGLFNFYNATKTVVLLNEYFGIAGYLAKGWIR